MLGGKNATIQRRLIMLSVIYRWWQRNDFLVFY